MVWLCRVERCNNFDEGCTEIHHGSLSREIVVFLACINCNIFREKG